MSHRLLAFHDLSEANYTKMQPILKRLLALSQGRLAIMVIPEANGIAPSQGFKDLLLELHSLGAILWLHGWKHKSDLSLPRSAVGLKQNKLTNNEAEFAGLQEPEANNILEESILAWSILKLPLLGFVPPTWHVSTAVSDSVLERGLALETRCFIKNSSKKSFSFPFSFFSQRESQFQKSVWACRFLDHLPFLSSRVVLHPADFQWDDTSLWGWLEKYTQKNNFTSYDKLL